MQRNWKLLWVKQLLHVQEIWTKGFLDVNTSSFHTVILFMQSDSVLCLTSDFPN